MVYEAQILMSLLFDDKVVTCRVQLFVTVVHQAPVHVIIQKRILSGLPFKS